MRDPDTKTILQFGQTGQVSRELAHYAPAGNYRVLTFGRKEADFTTPQSVADVVRAAKNCDAVINAAAYTAVDKAESNQAAAMTVNAISVGALAHACAERNVPLLHISTDYVFDGRSPSPYRENDSTNPINFYGLSKLTGENRIREAMPKHIILRTSWVYSSYGTNFLKTILKLGVERDELRVVNDQFGAPTAAADIAATIHAILTRLIRSPSSDIFGTFHYTAKGQASWFDFAAAIFSQGREFYPLKAKLQAIESRQYPAPAPRPRNSLLDCSKLETVFGIYREPWETCIGKVISQLIQGSIS